MRRYRVFRCTGKDGQEDCPFEVMCDALTNRWFRRGSHESAHEDTQLFHLPNINARLRTFAWKLYG